MNSLGISKKPSLAQLNLVAKALACLGAGSISVCTVPTLAAQTDIAAQPLATTSPVHAKPNLLFILDNSGSMGSAYMPDDMSNTGAYGYASAQCNGLAYDPNTSYPPPKDAAGNEYTNYTSITNVPEDGYSSSSTKYDLTGSVYYTYNGSEPKMGWTYSATTGNVITTTEFYKQCKATVGNATYSSFFTPVTINSATSAQQKQNYANWFAYYSQRYLLMRTAMGRAMAKIDNGYRVGFSTITDTGVKDGTNYFRDVKDFDITQKTNFYSSLYKSAPSSSTPLRGALMKAGRYFAKKVSGQTYDPMQYSCQRNYALLSTDGYWNANNESTTYGPYKLTSNDSVGNQDASEDRPMKDGSRTEVTTVDKYTALGYKTKVSSTQNRTQVWKRTATTTAGTAGGSRTNGTACGSKYLVTVVNQTSTQTQGRFTTDQQQATYTRTTTTVKTDGVITSGPTSSMAIGSWGTKTGTSQVLTSSDTGTPTSSSVWGNNTFSSDSCVNGPVTPGTVYGSPAVQTAWTSWTPSSYTYTYSPADPTPAANSFTLSSSTPTSVSFGSENSLADVAEYYWKTDLRDSSLNNCSSSSSGVARDVCANIVRTIDGDSNQSQHMNTYTIGLGVNGTLAYDKNYDTQSSGDFASLKSGSKNWPDPSDGGGAENIDDLWHAAVNGRGKYYSALNATELNSAIANVMANIESKAGAAAAAATSTLELVSGGGNLLFSASYTTYQWTGDLKAYAIDGHANISVTPTWSAQDKLDAKTYSDRKIYFKGSSGLSLFTAGNLLSGQSAYFTNFCTLDINPDLTGTQAPDQCTDMSTANKTLANNATNLVNYIRGDRANETTLYRKREHVLGDIINGAPVYVGKPPFSYADEGYAAFASEKKSRKPVVYVAANDGMLHAISADPDDGGAELWAYIPTAVLPNLFKLADSGYGARHQYFVDGAPTMGDIKIGNTWKTIVVGGLNSGGNSYYALDITDPTNPALLWEFTDSNIGKSYGNPIITKNKSGKWVVALTSGYNNTSGDGKGHFYLLDAATGASVLKNAAGNSITNLSTTAGDSTTPSGLAKINAWITSSTDNTAQLYYGGDLLGNVWRFDPDGTLSTASVTVPAVVKIGYLQIDSSHPQPITTKPVLAANGDKYIVIVGTGRYLGETDIADTTTQSIYALRDTLGDTGWGDVHADTSNFTKQTLSLNAKVVADATSATITSNKVDWTKGGWWVDLPQSGERVAINMGLQLGTLAVGTAIPNGDACASGGSSWRYYLGVSSGSAVAGADAGVRWSPNTLIVGISWVKDADGNVRTIFQDSDGSLKTEVPPTPPPTGESGAHRSSWRELID